jgi:tetratricopeptide (TPR) repeat protein
MKRGTRLVCIVLLCLSSGITRGSDRGSQAGGQSKTESPKALYNAGYYNALFSKTSIDSNDTRLQYAKLAYDAAVASHDYYEKANSLLNMGIAYNHQYRYNLAMESYLKAKGIADSIVSPGLSASVYHNMGQLYLDMRNTQLARDYYLRALNVRKTDKNPRYLAETLNGLALVSWLSGKLDTALVYLQQTLKIAETLKNEEGVSKAYNNIGIVYHEMKKDAAALSYLFKALAISEPRHDKWLSAEICNNIGEASISMGNYKQAEFYLAKARFYAEPIKASLLLADNYRYMARLYSRTGKYESAYTYLEKFHVLDDSLFNRNNYTIISELTSVFELEKKEQSILLQKQQIELLKQKKRNDNLITVILVVIILFMLLITWIIINRQKRINIRNRLLLEKDAQILEAQELLVEREKEEKKRLMQELENKNKFLIDFALYIGMKNEFLLSLREQLKNLMNKQGSSQEIKDIIFQLNQNLRYNKEVVDLQKNVEKVNFEFIQTLMERFPYLSENEKHLLILLRLKFSSKEIADIRAVSVKAVEISRYRLKKRMNLDDNDSLSAFIQKI